MIQVSYVSSTGNPISAEQLLTLLMQCRKNNDDQGVTGMLLYGNGTFLQAIEGEEQIIDDLVEKIWADPRHENIKLLSRRSISRREYADWTMAFERISDEGYWQVEGLKSFAPSDFNYDYLVGHEPVVAALMDRYREPHFDQLIGEINAKDKVIEHLKEALAQVRDRAQVTRLALESITEAARQGECSDALLDMCDATIASVRPK
ncbi:MAG: BLUF domain-containing protein [Thiohalocapsa sp.]